MKPYLIKNTYKILGLAGLFILPLSMHAQNVPGLKYEITKNIKIGKVNTFEPREMKVPAENTLYKIDNAMPKPVQATNTNKQYANNMRATSTQSTHSQPINTRRNAIEPVIEKGFLGALSAGIPNDNNVAVSKNGWVVSVMNSFVRVYNDTGLFLKNWSLEFFPRAVEQSNPGGSIPTLDRSYDPKVIYDPENNRFILVYLEGSESSDTRAIIAFSKNENPVDGWNVYQVNGNPFGGKTWSDYPIIAQSKEDLYLTLNILKDSTDWKDGFTQSIIWQIAKNGGYQGDSLQANLVHGILFEDRPIWSICPIPAGYELMGKGMFFLSVRPGDVQNDTVFFHQITSNFSDPSIEYKLKVLINNKTYGMPPDALQNRPGFRLQTNDARVLGGFFHAGNMQFVQTTRNFNNQRSAILHSTIKNVFSANPSIESSVLGSDTMDYAYPTIAYAGDGGWNNNAMLTFSHSSETQFPGTSVVYFNNNSQYSNILMTKKGDGIINSFLADTMERWGDYTSIQRDYANPGVFWIGGSFGNNFDRNATWVSKVRINDMHVGLQQVDFVKNQVLAFPNPANELIQLQFEVVSKEDIQIKVQNNMGQIVSEKWIHKPDKGRYRFDMPVQNFAKGTYFYQIIQNQEVLGGSFIVQ